MTLSNPRLMSEAQVRAISPVAWALEPMGRVNAATGTCTNPANVNDDNVAVAAVFSVLATYAEIDFGRVVLIRQYRYYGLAAKTNDGEWKLQYLVEDTWVDWETGILQRADTWSAFLAPTAGVIATTGIRVVATKLDTTGPNNVLGEIEFKHT